mmetsp:Transcript_5193/g.7975  ORF Transcript_5193/g.7975 Transcript_5193/m.7975 type:complete len:473 (+) Transcript_5193:68-1486(+)
MESNIVSSPLSHTPLQQSRPSRSESVGDTERALNDVLEDIPLGVFHYRLLAICGMSFMSDAMEVSLLSFMSTCVGIEWDLKDHEIALIAALVFAGILMGSLFWGPVADIYGRKLSFIWGAAIIIVGGFASALVQNYTSLVIFRALVGFGVGGITVPFDLLAEFMPKSHRGQFLMYIEYFWTLGSMFVAAAAWICLSVYGWRVLTFVTAIPVTISLVFSIIYLPESPRWLLVQGRTKEAEDIVKLAASVNGHWLSEFTLKPTVEEEAEKEVSVLEFLKPEHIQITLPLWVVWLGFGFTYYGVILFVARLFQHEGDDDDNPTCDFNYDEIFVSAVAEVVGVSLTAFVIDRWGRVGTQSSLYIGAGIAVLCMGLQLPGSALTAVSIVARFTAMGAASATWVATPELYDTKMRATAHAVANSISHLGGFLCPFLIDSTRVSDTTIGIIMAAVNITAGVCVLFLPETLGADLDSVRL